MKGLGVWSAGRAIVLAAALTASTVIGGCAWFSRSTAPPWIEGTSKDHPAAQYLTGVGQADSQPEAAARAYAAVSKIFKAEVTSQSKDWESFLVQEKKGVATSERRLSLDQVTKVSTDKVLENVRLLDTWKDPATNQHYALAGLERAQAGAAMQEKIAELDGEIQTALRESRETADKLAAVRNLRRGLKNLVLREAYNADLRIIRTSGQGIDAPSRVVELTAQLEQVMAANLLIEVQVTGEQAQAVRRAVIEGLVREGLPVTAREGGNGAGKELSDESKIDLLVKGVVRLTPLTVPDPLFKYARWCSDFVILDVGTQRVIGAVSRGGREGHLTESEAVAKAGRVMQQEVVNDLAKAMAGYVYGDAVPSTVPPPSACARSERQN